MQPEKFTQKSSEALQTAQRLAREHSHQEIDGEHLALALIGQEDWPCRPASFNIVTLPG